MDYSCQPWKFEGRSVLRISIRWGRVCFVWKRLRDAGNFYEQPLFSAIVHSFFHILRHLTESRDVRPSKVIADFMYIYITFQQVLFWNFSNCNKGKDGEGELVGFLSLTIVFLACCTWYLLHRTDYKRAPLPTDWRLWSVDNQYSSLLHVFFTIEVVYSKLSPTFAALQFCMKH